MCTVQKPKDGQIRTQSRLFRVLSRPYLTFLLCCQMSLKVGKHKGSCRRNMLQRQMTCVVHTEVTCSRDIWWGYFVPTICCTEFNLLNSMGHVVGTKYVPHWCDTSIKVLVHTRGNVTATYPWDTYPQHFHVCALVVILSLLHVASVCTTQVFSCCNMSLPHDSSCLPTLMR